MRWARQVTTVWPEGFLGLGDLVGEGEADHVECGVGQMSKVERHPEVVFVELGGGGAGGAPIGGMRPSWTQRACRRTRGAAPPRPDMADGPDVPDRTLANSGTSEGAKKGWETRRKNGWTRQQVEDSKKTVRDLADEALSDRSSDQEAPDILSKTNPFLAGDWFRQGGFHRDALDRAQPARQRAHLVGGRLDHQGDHRRSDGTPG